MNSRVLTVDIGNSRTHWALFENETPVDSGDVSSPHLKPALRKILGGESPGDPSPSGVIACSVAPAIREILRREAERSGIPCVFLTHENVGNLALGYSRPEEIGPDRLANALGAGRHFDPPFIIIDMGTAVTVDAITRTNGYEGGAIAPGLAMLSDYLAEKTALLPRIDLTETVRRTGIGRTTREAMEIGCTHGFDGMISKLVETVSAEVESIDKTVPTVLATGGSFKWVEEGFVGRFPYYPRLALEGLLCRADELLRPLVDPS